MTEPEPEKKSKKPLEQERLGLEEAIRLQEQVDEEERAQRARDEEIARQLLPLDEERATSEPKTTKDIDWNDPSVQKYWDLKNKPKAKHKQGKNNDCLLKNQNYRKVGRNIFLEKNKSMLWKQKVEQDDEKEELKSYLDIVPREDVTVDVEYLSTKYPIVDWKTYTLSENFIYSGWSKKGIILKPKGYDLKDFVGEELNTLFEALMRSVKYGCISDEYNLISWSLCDLCGVHILLMQNGIAIHMLTEKKYPLSQEMISKMLSKRLEVDQGCTTAYELLKFLDNK
ncbi:hypothetical protein Tco_0826854 [Tanacetum coccineum]